MTIEEEDLSSGVEIFRSSNHSENLTQKLYNMTTSGLFCDVTIHIGTHTYHAHRNILVASSSHFQTMFSDAARDFSSLPYELNLPANPTESRLIFTSILDYLYTGQIMVTMDSVGGLLRFSRHLVLDSLVKYCEDYLKRSLSHCNCFLVRELAKDFYLFQLEKSAESFVFSHITEIIENSTELRELSESKLEMLIGQTAPVTEIQRLKIMCQWTGYRLKERQQRLPMLLERIAWERVGPRELYLFLSGTPLLEESDWCNYQVLQSLKSSCLLPDVYFDRLSELKAKYSSTGSAECINSGVVDHEPSDNDDYVDDVVDDDDDGNVMKDGESEVMAAEDGAIQENKQPEINETDRAGAGIRDANKAGKGIDNLKSTDVADSVLTVEVDKPYRKTRRAKAVQILQQEDSALSTSPNQVVEAKERRETGKKSKKRQLDVEVGASTSNEIATEVVSGKKKRSINVKSEVKLEIHSRGAEKGQSLLSAGGQNGAVSSKESAKISLRKRKRSKILVKPGSDIENDENDSTVVAKKKKRRTDQSKPLSCDSCSFKTSSETNMESHLKNVHLEKEQNYSCSLCDFNTKWNREFYTHLRTEHYPGPPHTCDMCAFEAVSIQRLLQHRMDHTDDRPHVCHVCSLAFKLKCNMLAHVKTHQGVKRYECPVCKRTFQTKGTLDQHIVTHDERRPYLCDLCGFSTKYQSHLVSHRRIHTGDVFRCQHEGCNYSTPKRSQLACHERTHINLRAFVCSTCGRAFVEKSHLVRHERLHVNDKPFRCSDCSYASTRKDKLKEHRAKHHDDPPKAKDSCDSETEAPDDSSGPIIVTRPSKAKTKTNKSKPGSDKTGSSKAESNVVRSGSKKDSLDSNKTAPNVNSSDSKSSSALNKSSAVLNKSSALSNKTGLVSGAQNGEYIAGPGGVGQVSSQLGETPNEAIAGPSHSSNNYNDAKVTKKVRGKGGGRKSNSGKKGAAIGIVDGGENMEQSEICAEEFNRRVDLSENMKMDQTADSRVVANSNNVEDILSTCRNDSKSTSASRKGKSTGKGKGKSKATKSTAQNKSEPDAGGSSLNTNQSEANSGGIIGNLGLSEFLCNTGLLPTVLSFISNSSCEPLDLTGNTLGGNFVDMTENTASASIINGTGNLANKGSNLAGFSGTDFFSQGQILGQRQGGSGHSGSTGINSMNALSSVQLQCLMNILGQTVLESVTNPNASDSAATEMATGALNGNHGRNSSLIHNQMLSGVLHGNAVGISDAISGYVSDISCNNRGTSYNSGQNYLDTQSSAGFNSVDSTNLGQFGSNFGNDLVPGPSSSRDFPDLPCGFLSPEVPFDLSPPGKTRRTTTIPRSSIFHRLMDNSHADDDDDADDDTCIGNIGNSNGNGNGDNGNGNGCGNNGNSNIQNENGNNITNVLSVYQTGEMNRGNGSNDNGFGGNFSFGNVGNENGNIGNGNVCENSGNNGDNAEFNDDIVFSNEDVDNNVDDVCTFPNTGPNSNYKGNEQINNGNVNSGNGNNGSVQNNNGNNLNVDNSNGNVNNGNSGNGGSGNSGNNGNGNSSNNGNGNSGNSDTDDNYNDNNGRSYSSNDNISDNYNDNTTNADVEVDSVLLDDIYSDISDNNTAESLQAIDRDFIDD